MRIKAPLFLILGAQFYCIFLKLSSTHYFLQLFIVNCTFFLLGDERCNRVWRNTRSGRNKPDKIIRWCTRIHLPCMLRTTRLKSNNLQKGIRFGLDYLFPRSHLHGMEAVVGWPLAGRAPWDHRPLARRGWLRSLSRHLQAMARLMRLGRRTSSCPSSSCPTRGRADFFIVDGFLCMLIQILLKC
jgi:hypothetical protein